MIITKSELFTVYNKARAKARRDGDTKRIDRLNKSLGILQSKAYYTDDKTAYIPTLTDCGCKDWYFRFAKNRAYTGRCKHMLAEALQAEALEARNISPWLRHLIEQHDNAEV